MKKKFLIPIVVLTLVVFTYFFANKLILDQLNSYLAEFSPIYKIHIDDLKIKIWRGAYDFEHLTVELKKSKEIFFRAKDVDISVAWSELLKLRISANIAASELHFILDPQVKNAAKDAPEKSKKNVNDVGTKLFPLRVHTVTLSNSRFEYIDDSKDTQLEHIVLTHIDGSMEHSTPTPQNPVSFISLQAKLLDQTPIYISAHLNQNLVPNDWDVSVKMLKFKLVQANPYLRKKVPLTFDRGDLDIYAEIKSEKGNLQGLVKPFLYKVKVFQDPQFYKSLKHFGLELTAAAGNLILRKSEDKSVATKIKFSVSKDGNFKMDSWDAFKEALAHGFEDKVEPGFEGGYKIAL